MAAITKKDIRLLSLEDLQTWLKEKGEKPFRAKQIIEWLWVKGVGEFHEMTNLSVELRALLVKHFEIRKIKLDMFQKSKDGTIKARFQLHDGGFIEGVLIPSEDRKTACVSSQIGCSLNCKFCATGYLKRMRNLDPGEIYDQVQMINAISQEHYQTGLTNIVFMGMGEPLLNYKNVMAGIDRINSPIGLGMSTKRITLSTAGVAKMIKKLGDDKVKFNLALSLHATTDEQRDKIMPINEHNNLDVLVEALNYFYEKTKGRITFEYILLNHVNDDLEDAQRLVELCRRVPAKVNIIEYNPIEQADFIKPDREKREAFISYLENRGVTATVRRSRGKDIDAACGQLANKA